MEERVRGVVACVGNERSRCPRTERNTSTSATLSLQACTESRDEERRPQQQIISHFIHNFTILFLLCPRREVTQQGKNRNDRKIIEV